MSNTVLITTSTFSQFDKTPLDLLERYNIIYYLNPYERKLTENELMSLILKYQPTGIIAGVEPITEKIIGRSEQLKVISRAGIGMDSVDLVAADKRNIVVANTPDAPTIPVAELTLGVILSLMRKIHTSDTSIRKSKWSRPMGNLLYKKTVGIIGCGRIGSCLSKLLNPFECKILGYDPNISHLNNIDFTDLENLLSLSDIVTLHLPYSETTHHFIDEKELNLMKKGSFIINCSRGGLIDETSLFEFIKNNHLAGAALDCFESEPYEGPLKKLDNVLLTAHIGSYAKEGRVIMEKQAVENLIEQYRKSGII